MLQTITYVLLDIMFIAGIILMATLLFEEMDRQLRYRRLRRAIEERSDRIDAWKAVHPGEPVPTEILK